jgi:cold shock CspA family protein
MSQTGVLVSDDGATEWDIDAEALAGSMFRFLRPGQRVTFDLVEKAGGAAARNLRIGIS